MKNIVVLIMFLLIVSCSPLKKYKGKDQLFKPQIEALEQLKDHINKEDYILFVGSSSIRLWNTIQRDMNPYQPIKRGYGGAHYYDLIHHINDLSRPHHKAKAVVIFVANDITVPNDWDKLHQNLSPSEVKRLFKYVAQQIHHELSPETPVFVIETTPTPQRWSVWNKISKANDLIQSFCDTKDNVHYISTRSYFINDLGLPDKKFFVDDMLHLSDKGYQLWGQIIKEKLDATL